LTPAEADHLFRILKNLKDEGKTIILITHKLREIMAVTDSVSVMRRGEMTATKPTSETNAQDLAELMVGRQVLLQVDKGAPNVGAPVLQVENLSVKDEQGVQMLHDVSFEVRSGEILGVAGVAGNGQSQLLEIISGISAADSGRLRMNGEELDIGKTANPGMRRHRGIAHRSGP